MTVDVVVTEVEGLMSWCQKQQPKLMIGLHLRQEDW